MKEDTERLSLSGTSRRGDAGRRRLSLRVTSRRGAGKRQCSRVPYDRGKKSCIAGAVSAHSRMSLARVHGRDRARVRWRRMVPQVVEKSVSQYGKEIVEVVQIRPPERVQQVQGRIVQQIVDVPERQVLKEIVEVARVAPQERVQRRVTENVVAVPGSLFLKVSFVLVLHEQISEMSCEQIVEAPIPQDAEQFFARCVAVPVPQIF